MSRMNFKALYVYLLNDEMKHSVAMKILPVICFTDFTHLEIMLKETFFRNNGFQLRVLSAYHENDGF